MLYGLVLNSWTLAPAKLQEADGNRIHAGRVSHLPTTLEIDLKGQMAMTTKSTGPSV